eukprot:Plantae.Rhodophyta-Hildenbrandia_rubra.ctg8047.p1 GENE.Plantae.Rhodophyta-Hildenbrandia_rubra.ctg8047~~Plantae.Rhodophyta-Hildenbrandia_rubra.ctg8047.p1  ORF type:complete len:414 (-),score=48.87 Plantae.Rhodophyta-Hildenbrandia_rubra.ctg8047:1249-2490(-)
MVDRYRRNDTLRRYSITSTNTLSSVAEDEDNNNESLESISDGEAPIDTTQVELSIECYDLADMDVFSLSDAFCVVYADRGPDGRVEIGRTETVWNNLNPQFVSSFCVEHEVKQGHAQKIRFEVYDRDSKSERLEKHDFIGSAEVVLDRLRDAPAHRLKLKLENPDFGPSKEPGFLSICAEKVNPGDSRALVDFRLSATRLRKKGVNMTVAQFYTISRAREEADSSVSYNPVYRSEAVSKGSNDGSSYAKFDPAIITLLKLINGLPTRPLKFTFYRHKRSGNHQVIGYAIISLAELKSLDPKRKPSSCIIPLEGLFADDESLGNVILTKKYTDRHRTTFELKVDHFIGSKYISNPVETSSSDLLEQSLDEKAMHRGGRRRGSKGASSSGVMPSGRLSRHISSARTKLSNIGLRR